MPRNRGLVWTVTLLLHAIPVLVVGDVAASLIYARPPLLSPAWDVAILLLVGVSFLLIRTTQGAGPIERLIRALVPRGLGASTWHAYRTSAPAAEDYEPVHARLAFPNGVYVDESVIISLEVRRGAALGFSPLPIGITDVPLAMRPSVELDAPAFEILKENLRVEINVADRSQVNWNVLPKLSGKQTIVARFHAPHTALDRFEITESVRVNRVDHLTARQVWVLGSVLAILAGLLTALKTLKDLVFRSATGGG